MAKVVDQHIDQKSGVIVEEVLSDNAIYQLKLIAEIQSLLDAGKLEEAKSKLAEASDTLLYILEENCNLAKCEDALRNYEHR
ncbi:hypothetical protein MJO52_06410 [Microbulbifer variabilis]|uniref:CARD domain-containing protein n=1 Tax=Microbulbifer variabilis TaxID=266805 RepID=A0ABY4VEM4_9GAMM|nr:hypothetical protein [Microbulbifer variabilis]USD22765.1 hypothetical protein MJO52_06410 [Microbulbifer variabilis]